MEVDCVCLSWKDEIYDRQELMLSILRLMINQLLAFCFEMVATHNTLHVREPTPRSYLY